jgi:hypothetical protein
MNLGYTLNKKLGKRGDVIATVLFVVLLLIVISLLLVSQREPGEVSSTSRNTIEVAVLTERSLVQSIVLISERFFVDQKFMQGGLTVPNIDNVFLNLNLQARTEIIQYIASLNQSRRGEEISIDPDSFNLSFRSEENGLVVSLDNYSVYYQDGERIRLMNFSSDYFLNYPLLQAYFNTSNWIRGQGINLIYQKLYSHLFDLDSKSC